MDKLNDKVALITGGNSGIGLATARRFISEGAYVFITGRNQSKLDAAVKELGPNVTAVQGDVTSLQDLDRIFAQIKKREDSTSSSLMPASSNTPHWRRSTKSSLIAFSTAT